MARSWPAAGAALAVLWTFVRGPTTATGAVGQLLVGVAFGLPVAYGFRRIYAPRTDLRRLARAGPYAALYVGAFLWELVTANLDVAYRVLAPSMPIEPAVVVLPLRVQSDVAITTIANSISLTPGTLTMDYDADANELYVHTIDGRDPDAVVAPIRTWERYALVIFDEPFQPGDPVPGGRSYRLGREETAGESSDGGAVPDGAANGEDADPSAADEEVTEDG
ncbi:MAG: Na+/H+ antiporter subunit E [Halobacteriaceae archaeon]